MKPDIKVNNMFQTGYNIQCDEPLQFHRHYYCPFKEMSSWIVLFCTFCRMIKKHGSVPDFFRQAVHSTRWVLQQRKLCLHYSSKWRKLLVPLWAKQNQSSPILEESDEQVCLYRKILPTVLVTWPELGFIHMKAHPTRCSWKVWESPRLDTESHLRNSIHASTSNMKKPKTNQASQEPAWCSG